MKKISLLALLCLTACTTNGPNKYVANMYAKGTLNNYSDTSSENKSCPGCHVKGFDRVKLTVEEVLSVDAIDSDVSGCTVVIEDSLHLRNVSETRFIPLNNRYSCDLIYEKEKSYLKAMGFSE